MNPASELLQQTTTSQPGVAGNAPELLEDSAFPQLGVVRDVSMMRSVFQRALFGASAQYQIEECSISFIRYWPGEGCLIAYRISVRDSITGQNQVQRLSARVLPPGLSERLFTEAQRGALVPSVFGDPVIHLPNLSMVIWLFPNDPKLNGLPALVDESLLHECVLPLLAARDCGPDWAVLNWQAEVVSYVPEHRCTLRAAVQLRHKMTGDLQARTYYGKAYPDHTGRMTYRNMKNLRKTCSRPFAPFRVVRTLTYLEEWRILWQTGVAGMPLTALGAGSPELLRLLKLAARAIGALHSSNLECPAAVRRLSPLELLAEAGNILSRADHLGTGLVERLIAAAPSLRAAPRATVHRDLHLNNLVSTDDGIVLIDLDDLSNGDPVQDLACFLAHLCSWSIKMGLDGPQIEPMVSCVVRSYAGAVPWSIGEAEFRWHLAAALIYQQACRCITRPEKWRIATLNNVIRLAERVSGGIIR